MMHKILMFLAMVHQSEARLIRVFRNELDTDAALPYPIPKPSRPLLPITTTPPSAELLMDVSSHQSCNWKGCIG